CLQREADASENIRHYDQSLRWRIRRFFEKRNSIDLLRISTSNVITYVKKPQTIPTEDPSPPSTSTPAATADSATTGTTTDTPTRSLPSTAAPVTAPAAGTAARGVDGGNANVPEAGTAVGGVTGESSTAGGSQIEPGEYENLPFHGLQTPPKKAMLCKTNLAPSLKHNKTLTPSCFPTHPYNYINYQKDSQKGGLQAPLHPTLQHSGLPQPPSIGEPPSLDDSCKAKMAALDNSDTLSSHSFTLSGTRSTKRSSEKKLIDLETVTPLYENLTDSIQIHEATAPTPLPTVPPGKPLILEGPHQERYRISLKKPGRKGGSSRSNSAVSNSYYDCIKPIPAPRHRKYASTNSLVSKTHAASGHGLKAYGGGSSSRLDPIYMNLPFGNRQGHESSLRLHSDTESGSEGHRGINDYPVAHDNHYLEITQHQTRIVIPRELFPVDSREQQAKINQLLRKSGAPPVPPALLAASSPSTATPSSSSSSSTNSRRHIKLPLQKHHSFNFQSSQTVEATVRDLKIKSHSISSKTLRDYRGSVSQRGQSNGNGAGSSNTLNHHHHHSHHTGMLQENDSENEYYDQQEHEQQQQQQQQQQHRHRAASHFPYDTSTDGIVYPEDVIYADLEENNYGPINYKAASIYNMMKFKRNNE
uniref:Uncharacterized protein n=1 Tax=Anopheles maculatus TaxID=74869 RepID=A0A182S6N8_9DIPT